MDPRSNTPQSRNQSAARQRTYGVPTGSNARPTQTTPQQREAAASVIRNRINAIYAGEDPDKATPAPTASPAAKTKAQIGQQMAADADNPYAKTHSAQPELNQSEQWKKYHSAWQNYYQKYYEQYYVSAVKAQAPNSPLRDKTAPDTTVKPDDDGVLTRDEALYSLRQDIVNKASEGAKKIRRSRHFIPITAAFAVVLTFALLQYNQVIVANVKAYMTPGEISPQNIIVDPNADVPVEGENKMIIPKINVDAPVVMNVGPSNEEQLAAMADGIAHVRYPGASSVPGQVGNTVFSAHSSSDWTDTGAYKFIFVQLEKLAVDDVIYINYESKRYTYKVFDTKVVTPDNIGSLNYTGDKPIITLITCTPLGTAQKRLLVFAEQVSPDPAGAEKPSAEADAAPTEAKTEMVGTNPTLIERLFGN